MKLARQIKVMPQTAFTQSVAPECKWAISQWGNFEMLSIHSVQDFKENFILSLSVLFFHCSVCPASQWFLRMVPSRWLIFKLLHLIWHHGINLAHMNTYRQKSLGVSKIILPSSVLGILKFLGIFLNSNALFLKKNKLISCTSTLNLLKRVNFWTQGQNTNSLSVKSCFWSFSFHSLSVILSLHTMRRY